jgi:membrane fusion protein, copper/silver efflux system
MDNPSQNIPERPALPTRKKYWIIAGVILVPVLLFWAGLWYGQTRPGGRPETSSRRVLYYVDPMNPKHISQEPGLAPCGMNMEPVFADETDDQPAGETLPPGSVKITPAKQQMIGVRVAPVEKTPWTHTLRTVGRVAVDETRTYRLNAYSDGWIVKVYDNATGSLVRKDEPLAKYYNRDVAAALQTYYYALDSVAQIKHSRQIAGGPQNQLISQQMAAEVILMNLGMSKRQLGELARTRQLTQEILISAPVTSFVLTRSISQAQRFDKGEEFYRLADLSKVWVLADIYSNEAKYIKAGDVVQVAIPSQEEVYEAEVREILPQFDTTAQTIKVRLLLDNPDFELKPGMFVDVNFPIRLPDSLTIPVDALMDTGIDKTVFISRGNGYFEPRQVKVGRRLGDRVEIVAGLTPGDEIVTSGNFLIDSESRMKLAAAGFYGKVVQDPVCGLNVDADKAATVNRKREIQGKSYFFCSEICLNHFDKAPERYLSRENSPGSPAAEVTSTPKREQADLARDPVCGLRVPKPAAQKNGCTSEYQGITYYFDTDGCKQRFDQDPQGYLAEKPADFLVPPNPYTFQQQEESAVLRQIRRNILRTNPVLPGQIPSSPPIPPQPPASAPADCCPEPTAAPQGQESRPDLPTQIVPARKQDAVEGKDDCAVAPPPLPSKTSPPAPTPATPLDNGQKP